MSIIVVHLRVSGIKDDKISQIVRIAETREKTHFGVVVLKIHLSIEKYGSLLIDRSNEVQYKKFSQ